jgi:phenylpropionate dioxygenase-like ring-hydroxylating dioxygenase large terminal subunit
MDTIEKKPPDEGTAYGRKPQTHDAMMTEVGPGTPCGEFMRRYWQPVAVSASVQDLPRAVRVLGEDLVLFRDRTGRCGLVHPRCCHRGTTLYYGRVEEGGIRCCYHGWLFDVEGRCVEMPCEPEEAKKTMHRVRQPWYPVEERYGIVWAYMGPPQRKPVLPRWDTLESVGPDEKLYAHMGSFGAGGDHTRPIVPCNWLQDWENVMDPFHLPILHTAFSGVQFVPEFGIMPEVEWHYDDLGMKYVAYRKLDDGREVDRVTYVMFPHVRIVPSVELAPGPGSSIGWVLPVDDTHHTIFHVMKLPKAFDFASRRRERIPGKIWSELTEEEHQRFPGDWEAQVGQGPINLHSEEHLRTSDRGITMLRRLLKEQIKLVAEGGDPQGVVFDEAEATVEVRAGNFFR